MKHLYEIELTERELADIMQSLRGCAENCGEGKARDRLRKLATRIEAELWLPYHQSVSIGKKGKV